MRSDRRASPPPSERSTSACLWRYVRHAGWTTKIAELFNGAAVDPHFAVDQARREGFANVIPLVGYHQPVPFDAALRAGGGKKIAVYTGETFNETQYREIKALRG